MKTALEPTFVQTSNIGETKRATIKTSAKMFNFLSKQIYTDYFTAIWRELVANGIDAQKITGETRSPIVTVPSMLEPFAKVRDFGTGMGHEFMMDKFMAFADASTKEDSNDFIGGFGIGSKAPLAYTDQYSIKSFQRGTVRVYSVFKDAEGCPCIAFLSEAPTDEPDGVEVAFPVRLDDITKFTSTVQNTLEYFKPLPVLENTDLTLIAPKYDAQGDKWGLRLSGSNRIPKVVMGGVAYPISGHNIPYDYQTLRGFINMGLDVYMDIGEAEISLSREHITEDEALYEKLNDIATKIGDEFGKQMSKQFDACPTAWEAKQKLAEALKNMDYNSQSTLRKFAQWKNAPIVPVITKPKGFDVLTIAYGDWGWNDGPTSMSTTKAISPKFRAWMDHGTFPTTAFDRLVIDNTKEGDKPSLRIRQVLETYPTERILFFRAGVDNPDIKWKDFLAALGGPPKSMVDYLSKYQPVKVVRSASGTYAARPFKCYTGNNVYRNSSPLSELPVGGGLYRVMDNFSTTDREIDVQVAKMTNPKNIVFLNKTDFESSNIVKDPDWYSVEQGVEMLKATYRANHKNLAMAEAYHQWMNAEGGWRDQLVKLSSLDGFPKRGPFQKILELRNTYDSVSTHGDSEIRKTLLGVKYDVQLKKIEDLANSITAKFPLIVEVSKDNYLMNRLSDEALNRLF